LLEEARMVPDKVLQRDVIAELEFEPSVNAAHIGVTAKDGVVTLSGHVESFEQKLAAERAARRVRGVKAVAQEIGVRLPTDKKCGDDEIAERALKIIGWDLHLPASSIYVAVDHGLVKLHGTVDMHFQRAEAERQIRKLSGVVGVINELHVKPKPMPPDVRERLEAAMRRNAEIGSCSIGVYEEDGKVTLTGTVDNWHQREVAEHIAWSMPGVTTVDDRLLVQ
jgi:osmotically-inducible protein OsmY